VKSKKKWRCPTLRPALQMSLKPPGGDDVVNINAVVEEQDGEEVVRFA